MRNDDGLLAKRIESDDLAKDTITDAEIAKLRRVSLPTVRRWGQLGLLPPKCGPGRNAPRNREAVRRALAGEGAKA
jgi:hypothetical protein